MRQLVICLFLTLFSLSSYAKCRSFSFGINSPDKNEFAFFECKTKQVFQNSDLFSAKKKARFFIGESILKNKINYKRVNKILGKIVKKSKIKNMKVMFSSHNYHLTIDKQSYQVDLKHFNILKGILGVLIKNSKPSNGVLIKKNKFYHIKKKINKGPLDAFKLKLIKNSYFYNGLYWEKPKPLTFL